MPKSSDAMSPGPESSKESLGEDLEHRDLPPILLSDHVAEIFGISRAAACKKIRRGACGKWSRVDGRPVVRREAFLKHLQEREVNPSETPTRLSKSDPAVVRILRGQGRVVRRRGRGKFTGKSDG